MIQFTVPGVPVAQPRVKATRHGSHARVYTPKTADSYKASVALAARLAYKGAPLDGPLSVCLTIVLPRPKAKIWKTKPMPREWHTSKPDGDNIAKAVLDALKGIWVDDSQICELRVAKLIASGGEQPFTKIRISQLDGLDER